ncbi:MAG TPA: histidine kinase [Dinghuibacter sp.]|uniref:sensor histidine kinase n=1 Tax=Dinghuibacter sp. TaxID=2024697 RepID=UPI002C6BB74D|nr:histidine kinase [Dinghuibacter sp.]HTJ14595.1 histidine kinase [Dinghuibacter sp.]
MSGLRLHKRFYRLNLAVWSGIYVLFLGAQWAVSKGQRIDYHPFEQTTVTLAVAMVIFYGNFFLCNALFVRRKVWYWLSLAGMTALFMAVMRWVLYGYDTGHHYTSSQLFTFTFSLSMYFVFLVLLSGFYWSTIFAAQQMRATAAIQLELQKMATEKIAAEKKFLQSQVNPHFLHNTLNFLYAKSLRGAPELSDGIMTLSNIMKYALHQNGDFVPLADEVTHLENVIHIHQLRFAGRLQIDFLLEGDMEGVGILPFVLITFVENALKHGDMENRDHPIRIHLRCDGAIFFSVVNRRREGPKQLGTGIGLENVTNRLRGAYGANYSLDITDGPQLFKAVLTIKPPDA